MKRDMSSYQERLTPNPWIYLAVFLVVPASAMIFAPINIPVGIVVGVVLFAACVFFLWAGAPVIRVQEGELRAGRASIPLSALGEATAFEGEAALEQMRWRLDGRAWHMLRGWVGPQVLRIAVDDPEDPTPYWLLSSRSPQRLAAAIESGRAR